MKQFSAARVFFLFIGTVIMLAGPSALGASFLGAKWACQDGSQGSTGLCLSSGDLSKMASSYCWNHCNSDESKCGVNSFAVGRDCINGGLQTATWSCYDSVRGYQQTQCSRSSTELRQIAKYACIYHCNQSKCGVNQYVLDDSACSREFRPY